MDETIQQLREEIVQLKQEIKMLLDKVVVLEIHNKQLVEILAQDSHNSSWPSSRDKGRPQPKSQREKTGRKVGGQKGHEGNTLPFSQTPDVVEKHRPSVCEHCQTQLSVENPTVETTKRQLLELPPLRYITTEHQVEAVLCHGCGKTTTGQFPDGVSHPVHYGSNIKRLGVYLKVAQLLPYERVRELMAETFELPVTTGSLQNFVAKADEKVKPVIEEIKTSLAESSVAHTDETGFYIGGKRFWLHTVSTNELTYFEPHQSRGKKATEEINILPRFRGTLIHDNWATYFKYKEMGHALCNAHHLRELTAVEENDGQKWAKEMKELLLESKKEVAIAQEVGKESLSRQQLDAIEEKYWGILALGEKENPLPLVIVDEVAKETTSITAETPSSGPKPKKQRGRPAKTKARNLVERFEKRRVEILRFVYDFAVPFDNNLAERDIRMMKLQQKISGCFRSTEGAGQFCRLRSYISTIRKQGLSVWEALGSLFLGEVLLPSLVPE